MPTDADLSRYHVFMYDKDSVTITWETKGLEYLERERTEKRGSTDLR